MKLSLLFLFLVAIVPTAFSATISAAAGPTTPSDPLHGLVELSTRTRIKPFHLLVDPDGDYPSERVVFKDTVTGATIWKLSRNPGYNHHYYSNVPAWNLDGSELLLRSSRGQRSGQWRLAADGSRWRYLTPAQRAHWSGQDSHTLYIDDRSSSELVAVDLRSGQRKVIWKLPSTHGTLIPPSADGKKLLFVENSQSRTADTSYAWLINADGTGEPQRFDLGRVVHQTWFLKRPDYSFTFNCEVRSKKGIYEGQFICEPAKGGAIRKLSEEHFSHASVSPSGQRVFYFKRGGMLLFDLETDKPQFVFEPGQKASGHSTWQCDDRWLICSFGNSIEVVWPDERRSDQVCVPNTQLGYTTYLTEAHPVSSPDGTKVGYASSMLGDGDFYAAVYRRPAPPREVRVTDNTLTWQPPEHSRELDGYFIYANGKQLNREPVQDTRFTVPSSQATYVVTTIENCGLESPRSDPLPPSAPNGVTAKAVDPYTVELTWQPSAEIDVAHYNVYCSAGSVKAEQAHRVASPTVARTIDWGLRAGTEYHYLMTAVDRQGNESAPSALASVATPKIEAAQSTVNIGKVVGLEPVEVQFQVPRDDDYVIWVQLKAVTVSGQAQLKVSFDGEPALPWEPMWGFARVTTYGGTPPDPVPFWEAVGGPQRGWPVHRLNSGTHRLTLRLDSGETEVQAMIVTNDHGFVPEGITSFLAKREAKNR